MKRTDRFTFNSVAKKPKLQEEVVDDVWGDDPEIDEVDKCINLASQICSQQIAQDICVNNHLSLVSYDDFKIKSNIITSTQAFLPPPVSSTSKNVNIYQKQVNLLNTSSTSVSTVINKDISPQEYQHQLMQEITRLETQNKKLTEKYETKDGEISILRAQLKQTQKSVDCEKLQKLQLLERNQQQWNEKLSAITKDMGSLKCELELKNLEVINLKEKISEVNRIHHANLNHSNFDNSSQSFRRKSLNSRDSVTKLKRNVAAQTEIRSRSVPCTTNVCHSLQECVPKSLFEKCLSKENAVVKLKNSYDACNHVSRHSSTQFENIINFKPPEINNIVLSAEYFFSELITLMKCTDAELNSEYSIPSINKIIFVSRELLVSTVKHLQQIEQNMGYEDIRDMDARYLQVEDEDGNTNCIFSNVSWCENELAIDLRRCIAVLAALVEHSSYLFRCLVDRSKLELNNDLKFTHYSKQTETHFSNGETNMDVVCIADDANIDNSKTDCDILNILLDATQIIGKIRRSHQFPGFLASVLTLLTNLSNQEQLSLECYCTIHSIFKQIMFSRPAGPVLTYASLFLRRMSSHRQFVVLFCKNSNLDTFKANVKRDCFMFTEETCTFQITAILIEGHERNVHIACNVIEFLHNALECNAVWMYPQDNLRCECLLKVYSISIEILYELMEDFLIKKSLIDTKELLQIYQTTFRNGLVLIHTLTIRSPDLIIRCLRLYSQYQDWIKHVYDISDGLNLQPDHQIALETLLSNINNDVPFNDSPTATKGTKSFLKQGFRELTIL